MNSRSHMLLTISRRFFHSSHRLRRMSELKSIEWTRPDGTSVPGLEIGEG
jgi:hypothetical protein